MEVSALTHAGAAGHARSPLLRLQSDERLISLIRRGNHHAFEALVARYQARLLAFCRHMLSSREDAEDVLQEVFAAAFNAINADNRAINVRPWLYRIARNRSLNHLRKAQAIGVDSMDVHLSEHGITTADKVHKREEFRQLMSDVQDLPETQRTALLLREIDALSYDQIAEAMETTVPSVKSLLVRARVSLAEAAEARLLTCEEVRDELGEVAEGLRRTTPPVRRHLRTCDRCQLFRKQLRQTNKALAAIFPIGPLLLLKKALLAHAGTAAAGSGGAAAGGSAAAAGAAGAAGAAAGGALQAGAGRARLQGRGRPGRRRDRHRRRRRGQARQGPPGPRQGRRGADGQGARRRARPRPSPSPSRSPRRRSRSRSPSPRRSRPSSSARPRQPADAKAKATPTPTPSPAGTAVPVASPAPTTAPTAPPNIEQHEGDTVTLPGDPAAGQPPTPTGSQPQPTPTPPPAADARPHPAARDDAGPHAGADGPAGALARPRHPLAGQRDRLVLPAAREPERPVLPVVHHQRAARGDEGGERRRPQRDQADHAGAGQDGPGRAVVAPLPADPQAPLEGVVVERLAEEIR